MTRASRAPARSRSSAAALASARAIRPSSPPDPLRPIRAPRSQSSTASIDGVLIVSPVKMPSISLPPLVRRKIFGSGRSRAQAFQPLDRARTEDRASPCAASPPSTFCQLKVATSIFSQAMAERTPRWSRRQKRQALAVGRDPVAIGDAHAGGRTVPGEQDVARPDRSWPKIGKLAVFGANGRSDRACSCLTASVTQPSPKLSHASMVTGRRRACATSPFRMRRCRMPGRCRCGSGRAVRSNRVHQIDASARPRLADRRCDASGQGRGVSSLSALQPGGLAQGPDEKWVGPVGSRVRPAQVAPSGSCHQLTLLAESTRRVGTAWPAAGCKRHCGSGKAAEFRRCEPVDLLRAHEPEFAIVSTVEQGI